MNKPIKLIHGGVPILCTGASPGYLINLNKSFRIAIAKSLGGQTEVQTVDGRIDILTATEIIEVKTARNWKHALGQILVYGKHYPYHQKRIHLYGNISEDSLQKAILICRSHNVLVTREK
jgi:hypothetical protein